MSQLGKSPFTSSFDPASYLDDFLNALDNVPAEVTFILSEIREKDLRLRETQASIQAKQQTLRKYARSDTAAPAQEGRVRESINEKFNIAEQLAEEKMMLSRKLLDLLDRHLKKLDADMTRAREDWTDVIQQSADTSHAFLTDTTIAHLGEFDTGLSHLLHAPPPSSTSRKQRKSVPPTPSTLPLDTPSRPPTSVASLPILLPSSSSSSSLSATAAGSSTTTSAAPNAAIAAANARRKRSRPTVADGTTPAASSSTGGAPTAIGHAIHAALGPAIHPAVAAAAARQSLPNSPASFSSPTTPAGTPLPSMKSPNVGNTSGAAGAAVSGAMRHRHPKATGARAGGTAGAAAAPSSSSLRMDDDDLDDLELDSMDEDAMAVDAASAGGDDLDDLDDVMSVDSEDAGAGHAAAAHVQHPGAIVHGGSSRTSGGSGGAAAGMRGGGGGVGVGMPGAAAAAGSTRRTNTRGGNAGAAAAPAPVTMPKLSVLPHHHILHQQQQQTASMSSQDDGGDDDRLYCTCQRTSFGDMIGCDNASCRYEWFHLECLKQPPTESQEKWYCDECCRIMGLTNNNPALSAAGAGGGRKDRKRKA